MLNFLKRMKKRRKLVSTTSKIALNGKTLEA